MSQAIILPIYALCWSLGTVVGPILGGTLSNPAEKFPLLDIPLLRQYPYAMPCLVSSAFYVIGTALAYFLMEEVWCFWLAVARLAHARTEIDSFKQGTSAAAAQESRVPRCPRCCFVVCPTAACHPDPAVIGHLWIRSFFRLRCVRFRLCAVRLHSYRARRPRL